VKTIFITFKNFLIIPYFIVNFFIFLFITGILIYFSLFPAENNNYPVPSSLEIIHAGKEISTGLSHSFSEMIRGNLNAAKSYNIYGPGIFLFFFIQLIMRILFSLLFHLSKGQKKLIHIDATISIILFLITFYPFLYRLIVLIF